MSKKSSVSRAAVTYLLDLYRAGDDGILLSDFPGYEVVGRSDLERPTLKELIRPGLAVRVVPTAKPNSLGISRRFPERVYLTPAGKKAAELVRAAKEDE